jgi:hypothetical protein
MLASIEIVLKKIVKKSAKILQVLIVTCLKKAGPRVGSGSKIDGNGHVNLDTNPCQNLIDTEHWIQLQPLLNGH